MRALLVQPQWSPALETGKTQRGRHLQGGPMSLNGAWPWRPGRRRRAGHRSSCRSASMEPGLEDREDLRTAPIDLNQPAPPQWSPALKTGKTRYRRRGQCDSHDASMEPGRGDREDRVPIGRIRFSVERLNGARSWRPGRHADDWCRRPAVGPPQWSPVVEIGKTRPSRTAPRLTECLNGAWSWRPGRHPGSTYSGGWEFASMEPGLGDREDSTPSPRSPPPTSGLNGARPWRPGRRAWSGFTVDTGQSLNGARPWRPGRRDRVASPRLPSSCLNGARSWRPGRRPRR
ncbi:Hypothetical protein ACGLYG10_1968 [Actinomyces glycerinitolerans]|uniref:Uncharacterized protein n=1 Tax=Actinomyces glycerinitolerans TaxID=1892869 RepID=A0A1M4S0H4_9ACTO|nr:Hypothetical protein ACGLYG10_1968 [Actinomyces glycerinitolerans]